MQLVSPRSSLKTVLDWGLQRKGPISQCHQHSWLASSTEALGKPSVRISVGGRASPLRCHGPTATNQVVLVQVCHFPEKQNSISCGIITVGEGFFFQRLLGVTLPMDTLPSTSERGNQLSHLLTVLGPSRYSFVSENQAKIT